MKNVLKLAHIHSNKFRWYEVDIDEAEEIAIACSIRVAPTFQFYRNGALVSELTEPNRIKLNDSLRKVRSELKKLCHTWFFSDCLYAGAGPVYVDPARICLTVFSHC
eukprot:sb/3477710/